MKKASNRSNCSLRLAPSKVVPSPISKKLLISSSSTRIKMWVLMIMMGLRSSFLFNRTQIEAPHFHLMNLTIKRILIASRTSMDYLRWLLTIVLFLLLIHLHWSLNSKTESKALSETMKQLWVPSIQGTFKTIRMTMMSLKQRVKLFNLIFWR